jgi:hypothetical protein
MIFALAVFSLLCAVMVWIGLRSPKKSYQKLLPRQAAR